MKGQMKVFQVVGLSAISSHTVKSQSLFEVRKGSRSNFAIHIVFTVTAFFIYVTFLKAGLGIN